MKYLLLIPMAVLLTGIAYAERVWYVHDGDTLRLVNRQTIRVARIDAPELKQPLGPESRDALMALVEGKDIQLECNGKTFRRLVCEIYADGVDVQRVMVRQGWAFDYPKYSKGAFAEEEAAARSEGIGVWVQPNGGERPWDYRRNKKTAHPVRAVRRRD